MANKPPHLDPSELGTQAYWDSHYAADLTDGPANPDPSELDSWFADVKAPAKILSFLTSPTFPLSPAYHHEQHSTSENAPSILDLGTGNGSTLFSLFLKSHYTTSPMVGIDYSPSSIELARTLASRYALKNARIRFEVMDIVAADPITKPWWPTAAGGFDLVLDKGTFDAISLSAETVPATGQRVCEIYPRRIIRMIKPGGFLLMTSCNWTEEEVVSWFTTGEGVVGELAVFDKIKYPVFQFGGQKGQGVVGVCFQRRG